MLTTLFFYGSEHIEKQVQIRITTYNSISYKNFHSIGDMLIGSIKPLQAPYLKCFLFARRSEKSFSLTEISFQSTQKKPQKPVSGIARGELRSTLSRAGFCRCSAIIVHLCQRKFSPHHRHYID